MNLGTTALRLAPGLLLSVLLASCASLSGGPPPPPADPELAWSGRRLQLQGLQAWDFSGRISVTGPEGAWNARVQWTQREDAYAIYFKTPLGQNMARLEGGRAGVVLQMPDQEPLRAATAEELLTTSFGWSAPVEALRYWILGVPQPLRDAATRLDDRGRLIRLEQEGWRIDYSRYAGVGGAIGDMPKRLTLEGPPLHIRMVVDAWGIGE